MLAVVHGLASLDLHLTEETAELRWGPATSAFILLSAWWVKGPLLIGAAWASDLRRRAALPLAGASATLAFLLAAAVGGVLKALFERPRPPLQTSEIHPAVSIPSSASFPSGHAITAFAAASAIAVLCPRLRWPALVLAALVAFSRVYLGVHFWLDIVAGAALGSVIGVAIALALRRAAGPGATIPERWPSHRFPGDQVRGSS